MQTNALSASSARSTAAAPRPAKADLETDRPLVLVLDDDEEMRDALQELFESVGLDAICFASTRELLEKDLPQRPGCLVLDIRMPGSSGLDLQQHLTSRGDSKPIVFLTGHGDIQMSVQAMKAGAIDFFTKPVRDQTLLDAVTAGIQRDMVQKAEARRVRQHVERFVTLTPREHQVLRDVAYGRINKQIAFDLGISEITVKLHRGNVMRKMQAASVGELVRAWEALPVGLREKALPAPKYDSLQTPNASDMRHRHSGRVSDGHSLVKSAIGSNRRR